MDAQFAIRAIELAAPIRAPRAGGARRWIEPGRKSDEAAFKGDEFFLRLLEEDGKRAFSAF